MTERKVLIVRVKGGMQIAQGVTNHIIEGLVRGVLVLPEEVTSYAVEEFPALGVENEDTIYTVVPEGVPAIKILNKDDILPVGAFVQVQEESEQRDGNESQPHPAPQPTKGHDGEDQARGFYTAASLPAENKIGLGTESVRRYRRQGSP